MFNKTFRAPSLGLSLVGIAFIFSNASCMMKREPALLVLRGSVAESSEVVNLDPVFVSRRAKAEKEFLGFNSTLASTEVGSVPLSFDDEEGEVESTDSAGQGAVSFGSISLLWPVAGRVSSPFGMRRGRLHAGVDISAPRGTPILASASGQVLTSGRRGAYGRVVIVGHNNDHQTLYAHMLRANVREGDFVKEGDILGTVGRSGRATGYHLHFETRVAGGVPRNPLRYLGSAERARIGSLPGLEWVKVAQNPKESKNKSF